MPLPADEQSDPCLQQVRTIVSLLAPQRRVIGSSIIAIATIAATARAAQPLSEVRGILPSDSSGWHVGGDDPMDWPVQRLPAGMRYVSRSGHKITWSLDLPTNEDGLFALRCPQVSDHRFAVKVETGNLTNQSGEVYCPYCGYKARIDSFYTPEHRQRIDDAIRVIIDQAHDYAVSRLNDALSGFKGRTPTPSRPSPVRPLYSYTPEPTRRIMTCGNCDESYAVFGIALYCWSCGQRSPLECFIELLQVQRSILAHVDGLPDELRAQIEASGGINKIHEDTVKDTFSALEGFLDGEFRSRVAHADQVLKSKGNIFQRLNDASALYDDHLHVPLDGLDSEAWAALLNAGALRHLLTHANGIVDLKYLQQVPGSRFQIGQRIHVGRQDAEKVLDAATALSQALQAALT